MGYVGEWEAMTNHRMTLCGLNQIGLYGINHKSCHRSSNPKVFASNRLAIVSIGNNCPPESFSQIFKALSQVMYSGCLRGYRDIVMRQPWIVTGLVFRTYGFFAMIFYPPNSKDYPPVMSKAGIF